MKKIYIFTVIETAVQQLWVVGRVPSWIQCDRAIVPSSVYRRSNIFTRGFLWFQSFFSAVFRGSSIFSGGNFVVPKLFLVGISWILKLFLSVFFGYGFLANFMIQRFSVIDCVRKSVRKQKHKYISNHVFISKLASTKLVLFTLESYFIYQISYTLF